MAEPVYRVYVNELDDSLRKGTEKPAVYVGYSAKTPEEPVRAAPPRGAGFASRARITEYGYGHGCTSRIRSRRAGQRPKRWSDTWRTGSGVVGSRSTAGTDEPPDRRSS